MSVSNRSIAWRFLNGLRSSAQLDTTFALVTDDFTYWSNVDGIEHDREWLRRATEWRLTVVDVALDEVRCFVDGPFVVIEAMGEGVTSTGSRYAGSYAFIAEVSDGQLRSLREYCDTRLVAEVLAPAMATRRPTT